MLALLCAAHEIQGEHVRVATSGRWSDKLMSGSMILKLEIFCGQEVSTPTGRLFIIIKLKWFCCRNPQTGSWSDGASAPAASAGVYDWRKVRGVVGAELVLAVIMMLT